ncbi:MAG: hypothetical protein JWN66_2843 [Sphingomonas bacterium]|uniref:CsgG/HfaB family protein n=1 Tax=Sphingomonas bacterium TaxID=1895847 RepID=UPI00261E1037|nr:CsgG/HfaB family protein [Sphingomonas bacterium]MDB5705727.1 hypothetical protein [Sphingomonas bacterium]
MRAVDNRRPGRALSNTLCLAGASLAALTLPGCAGLHQVRLAPAEQPIPVGPAVRDNRTPMDAALVCFAGDLSARHTRPPVIAVGDVRDYTGKYSVNEGNAITQGGALMVYSALGKLGGTVGLAERFDPVIAERELGYTDRRQLGDGTAHDVAGPSGATRVPWLPYYGGSIAASDYYIVGGVTELNYDIRSGGIEAGVSLIGPRARTYTQSVAIDLRIVDTRSLMVVKTVSLTKQFTGYEVGFDLFRFFGSSLFDINLGAKGQEPLQLGIRTALEEATLRLVGAVTKVDPAPCLARQSTGPALGATIGSSGAIAPPAPESVTRSGAASPAHSGGSGAPANEPRRTVPDRGDPISLSFDLDRADLPGSALATIYGIAATAAGGPIDIVLLAPDREAPIRARGTCWPTGALRRWSPPLSRAASQRDRSDRCGPLSPRTRPSGEKVGTSSASRGFASADPVTPTLTVRTAPIWNI